MLQTLSSVEIKGVEVPIIFEQSCSLPIVSIQLVFQMAGKIENKSRAGLANFCAQVLGEGTKKEGALKFASKLEDKAINLSIYSGTETFVISLDSLKEEFDYGVKMLKKLLKNPNITNKTVQKIKKYLFGKLSDKSSDFDFAASEELKKLLYPNSSLQSTNLGDFESLEQITLKDVEKFIKSHLDIKNAMVVVGGDVEIEEVKHVVSTILKELPQGVTRSLPYVETSRKMEQKILIKPTEQAYIYFGSPFFQKCDDENIYKTKVTAFILGASGFGSRILEEIRVKRGLAYSAYGRIEVNKSHSNFNGYLQTKNENKDKAIQIVKEVIQEFVQKGVTSEELEQAKRFLLGSEPLRNETLSQRLSRSFSEVYQGFGLGHQKEQLQKIRTLEVDDLNNFIKEHKEIMDLSFAVVTNEN